MANFHSLKRAERRGSTYRRSTAIWKMVCLRERMKMGKRSEWVAFCLLCFSLSLQTIQVPNLIFHIYILYTKPMLIFYVCCEQALVTYFFVKIYCFLRTKIKPYIIFVFQNPRKLPRCNGFVLKTVLDLER